jgi:hypothetical protein
MNTQEAVQTVSLIPVEASDVVTYEQLAYTKPSKQDVQRQQTHSLIMAGVRITVRSEASVLCQVLIEIDSNRNGSFNDINDAFFSVDAQHAHIAAGMGDAGGIIQNEAVVSRVLAFIAKLTIVDPVAFERDMRTLSQYVTQSTDLVVKTVAGGR